MKVGDVVVAADDERFPLRSACEYYSHAIVASVDPFVLVSEHGDMMWSRRETHSVFVLCQAHPRITKRAVARFKRDYAERTNDQ